MRTNIVPAVVVIALAVAACGGGDGDGAGIDTAPATGQTDPSATDPLFAPATGGSAADTGVPATVDAGATTAEVGSGVAAVTTATTSFDASGGAGDSTTTGDSAATETQTDGGSVSDTTSAATNDSANTTDTTTPAAGSSVVTTTPTSTTPTSTSPPNSGNVGRSPASYLPTVADLPDGWTKLPDDDGESGDGEDCFQPALDALGIGSLDGPNAAAAAFMADDFGPFLSTVVVLDGGARVAGGFDALPGIFAGCDGTPDADGNAQRVQPISFAPIGDDAYAVQVDVEGAIQFSSALAIARSGDDLVFNALVAIGESPDVDLLEDITAVMVDRL